MSAPPPPIIKADKTNNFQHDHRFLVLVILPFLVSFAVFPLRLNKKAIIVFKIIESTFSI